MMWSSLLCTSTWSVSHSPWVGSDHLTSNETRPPAREAWCSLSCPTLTLLLVSRSLLRDYTSRQLEAGNACLPWSGIRRSAGDSVVFVNIPECAIIDGIDVHRGVVTPTGVGRCLHARPVDNGSFAQG